MPKLKVGDKMPNFTFRTGTKDGLTIDEVVKAKPRTVFWVLRYIGCPTCRYDVHVISEIYQQFLDRDAQVYVVMQSDPAVLREDLKNENVPFEIICDPEMAIYKELDIGSFAPRDPNTPPDPAMMAKFAPKIAEIKRLGIVHGKYEGNEQQLPALFITDADAKVIYSFYPEGAMDMPSPQEALEILDNL